MRRSTLVRCCIAVALLLSACHSEMPAGERGKGIPLAGGAGAQSFDPQSLIGVWSGRMNSIDNASVNVKMILTIEQVTDRFVSGRVELYPQQRPMVSHPVHGTLEGNKLRIGALQLTVFGNRMTGHTYGGQTMFVKTGGMDVDLMEE